jgi:ribosomal protein S18 acetylase RimI-like enzyme
VGRGRSSRRARRRQRRRRHLTAAIRALANTPEDVALGSELVREYVVATAEETGMNLDDVVPLVPDLHDFAGRYLDGGAYLVAQVDRSVAGSVGITPGSDKLCEMNRLWVRPPYRRAGVARQLCEASLHTARTLGFRRMALDVVPQRTAAIALYRALGFAETPPLHDYPFRMVFLGRDL